MPSPGHCPVGEGWRLPGTQYLSGVGEMCGCEMDQAADKGQIMKSLPKEGKIRCKIAQRSVAANFFSRVTRNP